MIVSKPHHINPFSDDYRLNEEEHIEIDFSDDELIDLSTIPLEKLQRACYSYEEYAKKPLYFRYAPESIYESIEIKDLEDFKHQLFVKYGVVDWQMDVKDYTDTGNMNAVLQKQFGGILEIIIPDISNNLNLINAWMNLHDYVLTYRKIDNYSKVPATLVHLVYIPKDLKGIRAGISDENSKLYHITPTKNVDSILKKGLFPRDRQGLSGIYYEPRLYFITGYDEEKIREYAATTLAPETTEKDYSLIVIDMKKIPEYVEFYYDPLVGKQSVFTKFAIAPDTFEEVIRSFIVIK